MEPAHETTAHMRHAESKVDETHHAHHIVTPKTYALVLCALLVLTVVTVLVAYWNMGGLWNLIVALGLATVKATIVTLWFMHVKYSGRLIHLVIGASLLFFIVMIFGILMDVWTRTTVTPGGYPPYIYQVQESQQPPPQSPASH